MKVVRQHDCTEIRELYGEICEKLISVVKADNPSIIQLFYMRVQSIWHRFYIDAGLLFWVEGEQPDEDEDILENEYYRDLGVDYCIADSSVNKIAFSEGTLILGFGNRTELIFEENGNGECELKTRR